MWRGGTDTVKRPRTNALSLSLTHACFLPGTRSAPGRLERAEDEITHTHTCGKQRLALTTSHITNCCRNVGLANHLHSDDISQLDCLRQRPRHDMLITC